MGTRADFYIGEGADARWLGSVAWDGYEWVEPDSGLRQAKTQEEYQKAVDVISSQRDDWTKPEQGWPWPWEDSQTTDYAYCYTDNVVKVFSCGHEQVDGENNDDEDKPNYIEHPKAEFPNMKAIQKVNFGKRSGVMIFGVPK